MSSDDVRLRKDDLRPGMKLRHKKTRQIGVVTKFKTNDHWSVPVHILSAQDTTTNKTKMWKINDVELV